MSATLHSVEVKKKKTQRVASARACSAAGFSLLELIVAMTIVLLMLAGASRLLMNSLGTRTRETQKSDALSDAQRALNLMSREIGNSGYGLDFNGIVDTDCHPTTTADPVKAEIRFRSNLDNSNAAPSRPDEDVTYVYQEASKAIVRYDAFTKTQTVLASGVDAVQITYIDAAGTPSTLVTQATVRNAVRVSIKVQVNLQPTVGQPASQVLLTSDIALRNAPSVVRRY